MQKLLSYMQSQDRNGGWLEWHKEIEQGGSEFNKDQVIEVLTVWYDESGDKQILGWIEYAKNLQIARINV